MIPQSREFFKQLVERGYHLQTAARTLARLERCYALTDLDWAIQEALRNQTPSAPAVEQLLLTTKQPNLKNLVAPALPEHPSIQRQDGIKPHDPAGYDF
jgi:hypothetical protein